ncbi:hypothetical protein GF420_03480 [candidate division GN15 bacterium]|nr:hypothetical protein [candidate division GN15 bacterium]
MANSVVLLLLLSGAGGELCARQEVLLERAPLIDILYRQPYTVYYYETELDRYLSTREPEQFLPLTVHYGKDTSASDSTKSLLLKSGLMSEQSLFYYWIPTTADSNVSGFTVGGAPAPFVATDKPPAPDAALAGAIAGRLDQIGAHVRLYDSLLIEDHEYHDHRYYLYGLGIAGCTGGAIAGLTDNSDLARSGAYAAVALGGFLVYKLIGEISRHSDRQDLKQQLRNDVAAARQR